MCPFVPTYDGAHELIRESLIRFDPEQTQIRPIRQREKRRMADARFCTRRCGVARPLRCIFVDFSEQFVLAGKCHATLSALPASPSTTHCLSLCISLSSPSSQISFGARRIFPPLFSHLIKFYALLALLASDATEQNPLRHVSPDPSRFHGHKPQETLTDEEEKNDKLLSSAASSSTGESD